VIEDSGKVTEYPIGWVKCSAVGWCCCGGGDAARMANNPHEILDIFFNLNSAKVCMLVLTPHYSVCKRFGE